MTNLLGLLWQYLNTFTGLTWVWLLGITLSAVWGVNRLVLKLPDYQALVIALAALFFTGMLFKLAIRLWLALLSALVVGAAFLLFNWANLWQPVWHILQAFIVVMVQYWRGTIGQDSVATLQQRLAAGQQAIVTLGIRLENWFSGLGREVISDPLVVHLIWGAVIWLAIAFLSWAVWRWRQTITAVLPLGALLTVSIYFSGKGFGYLIVFLFFTLLLQSSLQGSSRKRRWIAQKIDYADNLFTDLNVTTIVLSAFIMTLTFSIPKISVSEITNTIYDALNLNTQNVNSVAQSFGLDPLPNVARAAGLQGLPRSHLLGNSPLLGKQVVMTVKTGEFAPVPAEAAGAIVPSRHYWQSIVYNQYTSRGWIFSNAEPVLVEANQSIAVPLGPGKRVEQIVQRGPSANKLLHTSGVPLRANKQIEANYNRLNEMVGATLSNKVYTATSWVLSNDPALLAAAGRDYPPAVRGPYLALPATVPDRVRNLALELTATEPTPYHKAIAIEAYLRTFPYSLDVSVAPYNVDVVDYFLFDLQEGYCDYYASSMVVLARAAGLPARFVIGYVTGSYDAERAEYRITEAEAHSWPQIYFPDIGWVNFEPTAGRPAIDRRSADAADLGTYEAFEAELLPEESDLAGEATEGTPFTLHPFWWALIVLALFLLARQVKRRRLRRLPPREMLQAIYQQFVGLARRAGFEPAAGYTPYETAGAFSTWLSRASAQSLLIQVDDMLISDVNKLVKDFVRQQYAPPKDHTLEVDLWLFTWYQVRSRLWKIILAVWIDQRLGGLFRRATPPSNPTSSPNVAGTMGQSSQ